MPGGVDALRGKVDGFLKGTFAGVSVDDAGDFMIPFDDVMVWVRPVEWTEGRTIARVWSITNVGMPVDGDLTKFLVTSNTKLMIGGFRLDEGGPAVMIVHSLLGDDLDQMELVASVAAVAGAADHYAAEIKERFGGKLFTES